MPLLSMHLVYILSQTFLLINLEGSRFGCSSTLEHFAAKILIKKNKNEKTTFFESAETVNFCIVMFHMVNVKRVVLSLLFRLYHRI